MFPALEEIILGLCKSIEVLEEKRSPEQRYKEIMAILLGSEEQIRKLHNSVGRPFSTYNEGYCREKLYLGMTIFLKLYPNQTINDAAKAFLKKGVINTHADENNRARILASNYTKYKHFQKFSERQKVYKLFRNREFALNFHETVRVVELEDQKEIILKTLRNNDWPI